MGVREGGRLVGGMKLLLMLMIVPPATPTTTPTPPPPPAPLPPSTTPGVLTEPPPPLNFELQLRPKDCPVYVLGELRAIKKHGDTWYNDGSPCEKCECVEGLKRCYYHYCYVDTEVVTNPPAGRPPLDDEDGGEGEEEEGSGRPPPPPPPHYGNDIKGLRKVVPGELRTRAGENDTRPPGFCGRFCLKPCPLGYKMDPLRQCRQCSCRRRCDNIAKCKLRCPEGLAMDSQGCHLCQCRGEGHKAPKIVNTCKENSVRGCLDGSRARQVGEVWSRGPCVSCKCLYDGYSECNVTQCQGEVPPCSPHRPPAPAKHSCCPACQDPAPPLSVAEGVEGVSVGRAEVSVESAWERQVSYAQPRTPTPHGATTGDGAVKSAVQATGVEWWQVWVVMVPLAVVCVLAGVCGLKHWRRTHRDKYDINSYRPSPLTEKLRPVTTADDHHLKARMM